MPLEKLIHQYPPEIKLGEQWGGIQVANPQDKREKWPREIQYAVRRHKRKERETKARDKKEQESDESNRIQLTTLEARMN